MNYDRFLSDSAKLRRSNAVRESYEKMMRSGLDPSEFINMSGGVPNPETVPFESAEFKLKDGSTITLEGKTLTAAMQYGPSTGHPALVNKLRDFLIKYHNPPTAKIPREEGGFDLCVCPGAQSGVQMSFDLIMNPGDNYIVEEPTYMGALSAGQPMKCNPLAVPTDSQGMIPSELRKLLERWGPAAAKDPKSDIPKILYLIPTGANPSGVTYTKERRQEVYQVAREYDMIIVEDDAYFFVNYAPEKTPSFLSMDVDGRVLRIDTFAKVIAAGLRVGIVSGPEPLMRRILWTIQVNVGHATSLSQVLICELLDKWGDEGFEKQVDRCRKFYMQQKDLANKYAKKHLADLAEWVEPSAGMFLWMKIKGIRDTNNFIEGTLTKQRVLFAPGFCFMADQDKPSSYMRVSFSNVNAEQMDKSFQCLAIAIREELASIQNGSK